MSRNMRSIDIDSALVPTAGRSAQTISTAGSVQTLAAFGEQTKKIIWTARGGNVSVTFDGGDPSATEGHLLASGASGTWDARLAAVAKFFLDAGASVYVTEMTY